MIILGIGLIAVCLGGAVGYIAVSKGRSFVPWFLYGTFLGPVALPHALLSGNRDEMVAQAWSPIRYGLPSGGHRTCPYCDAVVHEDAIACRRCRRPFYGPGSEPAGEGENEPADEPFAFEALEAAIARRSAGAHDRRGSRREPPPGAGEWRRPAAPASDDGLGGRQEKPADDDTPMRETADASARREQAAAPRRDTRRSAAARAAAQPSRSAPPPEARAEAEEPTRNREEAPSPTPERAAPAADREQSPPPVPPRTEGASDASESARSTDSTPEESRNTSAPKAPPVDAEDGGGRTEGAESGPAERSAPRPESPERPKPVPANDPPAAAAARATDSSSQARPEREEKTPDSRSEAGRDQQPAARTQSTARSDPSARPAAAQAHSRWRDAEAARNGEPRPLRAGERPGPGPEPQDDLWTTWRDTLPAGGAERTKRAALAAAAVLCVVAVGALAWQYGPAAMQQVAMAPSLFDGDGTGADLDDKAVEVPERALAAPAPNAGGAGAVSDPESADRPGDEMAVSQPPPDDVAAADGGGSADEPARQPSQPSVETADVPAPTGSAAATADGGGGSAEPGDGAAPTETASVAATPDGEPSQAAAERGAPSSATDGPIRLQRERVPEPGRRNEAVETPTAGTEAPTQGDSVDDLVKAVTAALAEHTARRDGAPEAASGADGGAKPAAVRITATGDLVARVQQLLRARGFAPGPIDGRAGPQTREAIRKYQQRMGMRTTGEIDKAMLISLGIL